MELTKSDLRFILSRCPRDVVKAMRDNPKKLYIAGGFIRATIAGEKVSDIDMFGRDMNELLTIAKDLALSRKGRYFTTKNAITVLKHPRQPLQFITRWLFNDPKDIIKSFDFTIAQATIWATEIWAEGEDKPKIIFKSMVSDTFYSDLAARRLVYTSPVREEEAGGSMLRILKFVKRGYNIQTPSLGAVIARLATKLDFNRTPEESWIAQVVTGLLREVDPLIVIDGVDFIDEHEVLSDE